MLKVAIRGLFARRLRLALTGLAVALGVTLIAGTYVYTDTINQSFDKIFAASFQGSDVVISPHDAVETEDGQTAPLDAALLDKVRATPGIAEVEGSLFDQNASVLGKDGKRLGNAQAPQFVASTALAKQFEAFEYVEGRKPAKPGEVAMDRSSANREGFALGDKVGIQGNGPREDFTLVGLARIAGVDSFGGAVVALMPLAEAQRVVGKEGKVDQILATVEEGTDAKATVAELQREIGPAVDVRTGVDEAKSESDDSREDFSFLSTALLAFAGISLFVGAFLIFNTFSITVAQRAREFALLRTLGAKRGQVLRSVLAEGVLIGAVGSAAGLALGILTAKGLQALFKAVGLDLPSNGTVVETRTIVVSLAVGMVVTLVACLAPALRATRVPPVAALREGVIDTSKRSRIATPLAVVLTTLGFVLIAIGLFAGLDATPALTFVGFGAGAAFLGTALLSPRLVKPLAGVIGRPIERAFGLPGRLARENTTRLPGRTAVTSAALMIGVALVTFATIFAASAAKTLGNNVDEKLKGEIIVQHSDGFSSFTPAAVARAAQVPGVKASTTVRRTQGAVAGDTNDDRSFTGIDPKVFTTLFDVDGKSSLDSLVDGALAIDKDLAEKRGWDPGTVLKVTTPANKQVDMKITGTFDDKAGLVGELVTTQRTLEQDFGLPRVNLAILDVEGDAEAVSKAVTAALRRDFPQAEAFTAAEFKQDQEAQLKQVLGLIYALLSLSIIVSLFGIVNTLVLSITERTRELGMLRAIGTTRKQVKQVVRYEAVITALIGGVIGSVLGIVLSILVAQPLEDFMFTIPVLSVFVTLILAGVAGILAAALPARRAAKLNVLEALAYE